MLTQKRKIAFVTLLIISVLIAAWQLGFTHYISSYLRTYFFVRTFNKIPGMDIKLTQHLPDNANGEWIPEGEGILRTSSRDLAFEGAASYKTIHKSLLDYYSIIPHYEASSTSAVHWIFETYLKPRVEAAYHFFLADPNYDRLEIVEGAVLLVKRDLEAYEAQFGSVFAEERQWLENVRQQTESPSVETGWQELHPGVWKYQSRGKLHDREKTTYHTDDPTALKWLLDNELGPKAEIARQKIEELGEEKAEELGFTYDVYRYEMALETYEFNRKSANSDHSEDEGQ